MAYNPDEIAKVKHLNEFARQIRIKLDGGTDPKAARTLTNSTIWSGNNQIRGTVDGFNITCDVPLSKVTNNGRLDVWIYSNTFNEDTVLPTISGDFSSLVSMTWAITRWAFVVALAEIKAQTVNIQIYLPENDTYQDATINITINITEG